MKVDVFYKVCRAKLGSISKAAQGGFELILREAGARKTETNHLAYMLATAWWETAKTMQPVREAFFVAPNDFEKAEAWRRKNLHYHPYYGRGFVQLTWKTNYEKASKKFGVDFVKEPDRVMEPQYAVPILFEGMAEGWFTGKALDDYIDDIDEPKSEDLREYKEARRIINGTDKADTVARIAVLIEEALRQADYGTDSLAGFATANSAGVKISPYSWIADGFGPGGPGDQSATVSEAALPAASGTFAAKLVEKAQAEFHVYKGEFENVSPLKERIGKYWNFLNRPDLDGADDVPWSAAFISYMVHLAGAGTAFPYSAQHSVYFYRIINDLIINKKTSFRGYRVGEITIQPGDIIGMNRAASSQIDYDRASHHSDYKSHADIVVGVDGTGVSTIGGNVGAAPRQVSTKKFIWSGGSLVNSVNANQKVFVVIRSFLP